MVKNKITIIIGSAYISSGFSAFYRRSVVDYTDEIMFAQQQIRISNRPIQDQTKLIQMMRFLVLTQMYEIMG